MIKDLVVNLIVNNLESLMFYILTCSFTCKKLSLNIKKVIIGLIWGSSLGVFITFFDSSIYKFICYIILFLMIKLISKYNAIDVIMIFELITVFVFTVNAIAVLITQILSLSLHMHAVIAQLLSTIFIYWLGKLKLYTIIRVVEKQVLTKLLLFVATILFLLLFYRDFEPLRVYCFIVVLISIVGSIYSLKDIYFYTTKYPEIYHDMRNMIAGIFFVTQNVDPELQKELRGYYNVLGFDVNAVSDTALDTNKPEDKIKAFIDFKISTGKKEIKVNTDIRYYENNISVPASSIIYMLGILLDNAIDAVLPENNINVYIQCAEYNLDIEVSNRCENIDKLFEVFERNKSTKSIYRGYGIPNLKKMVKNYEGVIQVKKEYDTAVITIIIRN